MSALSQTHIACLVASMSCVTSLAPGLARAADTRALEEVIVTAQKRSERLQDVPVPVTAISAEDLASNSQSQLRDYYTHVPGLNVTPGIQSNQTLAIRGITTGSGNPTVGVTIDDVPFGASTNLGGGRAVPDIDPGDLQRVEVLRGPQGTLYGASSLGGLLKFVTRDPSTDDLGGQLQANSSDVVNGDDLGYSVRGSVNVPLLRETFAVRASGFFRRDPGYIDNVQTGERSINSADANGGRLTALWRLSDEWSVKVSALIQEIDGDGAASVDPTLGDLRQSRLRDSGWYERKAELYSATVAGKLGAGELTSITGYGVNSFSDSFDLSFALGAAAQAAFGVTGVPLLSDNETKKVSQEMRFNVPLGDSAEWLLGAFYTDEDSELTDLRLAVNPVTGATVGRMSFASFPTTFEEYAAFTDLTYHFTDRFDVQFGGRHSEIEQTFSQTSINTAGVQSVIPELTAKTDAFTYLVTPRFEVSPDLMLYARLASGYRAGGTNIFPGGVVPPKYEPDETQNYELGLKGDFLGGTLSADLSLYYIDWKDIQLTLVSPGNFTFTTNGSRARSHGAELAVQASPVTGLQISGWFAWNDAELTEPLPPGAAGTAVGRAGERLPNTSRVSSYLSVDQEFSLTGALMAFIGGSVAYVGDRVGPFRAVPVRQEFESYTQVDLRVGLRMESWSGNIFATNVSDERGALFGGLGANPSTAFTYIQPRTIGVSLSKTF
jgi:iron complex outermembrane receptor protein